MKYIVLITADSADNEAYGPFEKEEEARAAASSIWAWLRDDGVNMDDLGLEVLQLRQNTDE